MKQLPGDLALLSDETALPASRFDAILRVGADGGALEPIESLVRHPAPWVAVGALKVLLVYRGRHEYLRDGLALMHRLATDPDESSVAPATNHLSGLLVLGQPDRRRLVPQEVAAEIVGALRGVEAAHPIVEDAIRRAIRLLELK